MRRYILVFLMTPAGALRDCPDVILPLFLRAA
jgi:hypothetical protein